MNAIFVETMALGGDGPKVAVKDTIDIAGTVTRAASRALEGAAPATCNAAVVEALLAAGCRIVGKTNLHELAYGVTGINNWTGTAANTHFPDRIPGGSSSGSAAAVAAGLADFAIGTDTGGSIRIPAACCGVIGLKPTYGRLSRAGVFPGPSSLDCVGPFAASIAGIELAMAMMDPAFERHADIAACRLGIVTVNADPDIAQAVDQAARKISQDCTPVTLDRIEAAFEAGLCIIAAENWITLGGYVASPGLGEDVRQRLLAASKVTAEDVTVAEAVRRKFSADIDAVLEHVDVLVLPTMPAPPLQRDVTLDPQAILRSTSLVRPFNLSGHPAISLPLPAVNGFSVGLQLVARRGEDALLCAVARNFEKAFSRAGAGQPV